MGSWAGSIEARQEAKAAEGNRSEPLRLTPRAGRPKALHFGSARDEAGRPSIDVMWANGMQYEGPEPYHYEAGVATSGSSRAAWPELHGLGGSRFEAAASRRNGSGAHASQADRSEDGRLAASGPKPSWPETNASGAANLGTNSSVPHHSKAPDPSWPEENHSKAQGLEANHSEAAKSSATLPCADTSEANRSQLEQVNASRQAPGADRAEAASHAEANATAPEPSGVKSSGVAEVDANSIIAKRFRMIPLKNASSRMRHLVMNSTGLRAQQPPQEFEPSPLWQRVVAIFVVGSTVLLVGCLWCFCCCAIYASASAEEELGCALGELRVMPPLSGALELVPADEAQHGLVVQCDPVARGVLAEAILGLMLPAFGFAAVILVWRFTGERQVPSWLAVVFLPFVYRNKVAEASLLRHLNRHEALVSQHSTGEWLRRGSQDVGVIDLVRQDIQPLWEGRVPKLRSLLGGLDVLDGATDGMAAGAAFLLDPRVHPRFVASFNAGAASVLAPFVNAVHLWGIMAIVLMISLTAQLALSLQEPAYAAELAGLGALADRLEPDGAGTVAQTARGTLWLLAKVLSEQVPQLWLQTSLMMALGKGPLAQPVVLLSVTVGLVTITKKSLETLCAGCSVLRVTGPRAIVRIPLSLVAFVVPLSAIAFAAFIGLRLVMIHLCEDHCWGATTGCVAFDDIPTDSGLQDATPEGVGAQLLPG